ncbi:8692_t:CDS:2 [Dentiscutata erythropus]|uniref:8692_t:CDS:1 n=1 Tax=Dentiscutata erythropus TaxID=1348616 RepID=A0A9N9B364_9GLOM|nr:8692_t:CDS:2 [Dentiscutata erythropus]
MYMPNKQKIQDTNFIWLAIFARTSLVKQKESHSVFKSTAYTSS